MEFMIIYYTANVEDRDFENKIIDNLKDIATIPIISVSQKPIDLGENICVGERGNTYLNAFRQLLIGCEMATSEFIFTVEADCLYPKGYFDFIPQDPNIIYNYDNVWVMWKHHGLFKHKEQTHASVVYERKFLIRLLKKSLKGLPEWSREKVDFPFYINEKFESFTGEPIISIKTGAGIQKSTKTKETKKELSYWGTPEDVRERLWITH